MSEGWGIQPNIILHEFGHMLDHYLEHLYPKSVKEQIHDRFDDLKEEEVKRILSKYGATQAVEFRAEVIAGILSGKSFPKEFLKAAYLDNYLKDERGNLIYQMGSGEIPNTSMVEKQFGNMMEALFNEKGASLKIELLGHPEVSKFIESHAQVLENPFQQTEMSDLMRTRLQESAYIFSGFKTFHELGEAFPSLLDEKGHKKPFNQFLNDVQKIDQTYNKRYLQAEYNFASASSDMAARWEQFAKDEDEYYLQYRTANDGAVRPEHAALHDVTLPASDSFWDSYYPPNGWNCRCTVVQVLRYMHEATPHDEAMQRGSQALAKDKKGMFNFNPGKQQKLFPDYNPYTISKCRGCTKANLKLFAGDPSNPLCSQVCPSIRGNEKVSAKTKQTIDKALEELHDLRGKEYRSKLKEITELKIFKQYENEKGIFYTGGIKSEDFDNQLNAAKKAVSLGYTAYILPNPKGTRSGDFILERKNYYAAYDLKTISGKNSVGNRLAESVGQARNVLLNMNTSYNPRSMANEIKWYFEQYCDAEDVVIFKGKREIKINSKSIGKDFIANFIKSWSRKK